MDEFKDMYVAQDNAYWATEKFQQAIAELNTMVEQYKALGKEIEEFVSHNELWFIDINAYGLDVKDEYRDWIASNHNC